MPQVTDPALLAQLNAPDATAAPVAGSRQVTDPALLAQLNGASAPAAAPPSGPDWVGAIMRSNPITSGIDAGLNAVGTNSTQALQQALSGVNRGIAHTADLPKAALSIGPELMNAIFKTNYAAPDWMPAPGNAIESGMAQTGMVKPRSDNLADRLIESSGEGIGGALIPEVGLAARAGGTLADVLKAMGPAASSGIASGATAEVAPDNPGAQIAAGLIGGVVPTTALSGIRAITAPKALLEDGTPVPGKVMAAVQRDGIPLDQVQQHVADLGPAGTVADLGDNTQKLAMGVATQPGEAGATIANAMKSRAADAGTRVPAAVNDILGPATPPSQIVADLVDNKRAVGPLYEAALKNAAPVDLTELANGIDAALPQMRGPAQAAMRQVRGMLNDTGPEPLPDTSGLPQRMSAQDFAKLLTSAGNDLKSVGAPEATSGLTTDPATLLNIRNAIDGMITPTTAPDVRRVLSGARGQVDAILSDAAPGIKDADAQYRELARQGDALDAGGSVLDGGKSAVWPQDNVAAVAQGIEPQGNLVGPSAATFRLSQGARADIERIVGTKTNDRIALANILQGDSDWNPQKLAQLFGQDKADQLMQVMNNERQMAGTENLAINGSKTAAATAAQGDLDGHIGKQIGQVVRASGWNPLYGATTAGAKVIDFVTDKALTRRNQAIADSLVGPGNWTVPEAQPFFTPQQRNAQYAAILSAIMRPASGAQQ